MKSKIFENATQSRIQKWNRQIYSCTKFAQTMHAHNGRHMHTSQTCDFTLSMFSCGITHTLTTRENKKKQIAIRLQLAWAKIKWPNKIKNQKLVAKRHIKQKELFHKWMFISSVANRTNLFPYSLFFCIHLIHLIHYCIVKFYAATNSQHQIQTTEKWRIKPATRIECDKCF